MISFDVTERVPTTRNRGSEFEPVLKAAFEDRKPREATFSDLAEANRTRDTLRKVASRNSIGLDMEIQTEGEGDDAEYILVFQAREQRKQEGAKRGRKAKVADGTDSESGDPFEDVSGDAGTDDDEADEPTPESDETPAPAETAANPSTARVTRPRTVRNSRR